MRLERAAYYSAGCSWLQHKHTSTDLNYMRGSWDDRASIVISRVAP